MTIVRYKAIGQNGRDGWYAMVTMVDQRAIGTLYEPGHQKRGRVYKQFNVKVNEVGSFRVGIGTSGFHIRFQHRMPICKLEDALKARAKLNMDRAAAKAVAKLKAGIEALMEKHKR